MFNNPNPYISYNKSIQTNLNEMFNNPNPYISYNKRIEKKDKKVQNEKSFYTKNFVSFFNNFKEY